MALSAALPVALPSGKPARRRPGRPRQRHGNMNEVALPRNGGPAGFAMQMPASAG
jgi:hypothetical protein